MNKRCNKACYSSKKDALSVINYVKKSGNRKKIPKRAYYCQMHDAWHMTSVDNHDTVTYEFKIPEDNKIIEKINEILT